MEKSTGRFSWFQSRIVQTPLASLESVIGIRQQEVVVLYAATTAWPLQCVADSAPPGPLLRRSAVASSLSTTTGRQEKAWIKAGRVDDKMATQNEPFYLRY